MKRFLIGVSLLLLVGCTANTYKLMNLKTGMDKNAVMGVMGQPTSFRGAATDPYGRQIEIFEYQLYKTNKEAEYGSGTPYFLRFINGELVQWGERGDWDRITPPDKTYELRVN